MPTEAQRLRLKAETFVLNVMRRCTKNELVTSDESQYLPLKADTKTLNSMDLDGPFIVQNKIMEWQSNGSKLMVIGRVAKSGKKTKKQSVHEEADAEAPEVHAVNSKNKKMPGGKHKEQRPETGKGISDWEEELRAKATPLVGKEDKLNVDAELKEKKVEAEAGEEEPKEEDKVVGKPKKNKPVKKEKKPVKEEDTAEKVPGDYMMWVGYTHYPTIESFTKEAEEMGISKRAAKFPKDVIPGKSRVFLAHDEGVTGDAVIFGYFIIKKIQIMVKSKGSLELDRFGGEVEEVTLKDAQAEKERRCGPRATAGTLYFIQEFKKGDESIVFFPKDKMRDYAALVDASCKRFKSLKCVEGDRIINSKSYKKAPNERTERTIKLGVIPNKKQKWTEEEWVALRKLVKDKKDAKYQAFKEFARQTNRTLRAVEYQWYQKEHVE